jgi:hypothetical protein
MRIGPILVSALLAAAIVCCAAAGWAQQDDDERPGVRQFDDVTVETIRPEELPSTVKPGAETLIRTESDELPGPVTRDDLQEVLAHLSERVVRVAALQTPPRPYRQVPSLHIGHGVWVSPAEGEPAHLVTPLSWLKEAEEIFVLPPDDDTDEALTNSAPRRSLSSVSAGQSTREWLDEHEDELVEVELREADEHRNLVELTAKDEALPQPPSGVDIFDVEHKALFNVYGFSRSAGASMVQTKLLANHPDKISLSFYWQTTFPVILGAPLVSSKGELVALTVFHHPEEEEIVLAIPTTAIRSYLSPEDDEAEDDE